MTQRVPVGEISDLLAGSARAAMAYAGPDGPECVPVVVRTDGGIHVGMTPDAIAPAGSRQRVVLVIDDGRYWFQLRAALWRGTLAPEEDDGTAPAGDGLVWFRLEPQRSAAWDYGRLREEPAG